MSVRWETIHIKRIRKAKNGEGIIKYEKGGEKQRTRMDSNEKWIVR